MSAAAKRLKGELQVITANRLCDGVVIYLQIRDGQRRWCGNILDARVFAPDEIETVLAGAMQDVRDNLIVEPYAIAVSAELKPQTQRETIRAGGPTIAYAG